MKYTLILLAVLNIYCSSAQNLKIMTYNIRSYVASDGEKNWRHRKDFFASQIQFYEPDIFGVQEAKPNNIQLN